MSFYNNSLDSRFYAIVGTSNEHCIVTPIYEDGGGRIEDRSIYEKEPGICPSISIGEAILKDNSIVGAQIIKKSGNSVVAFDCYLGTVCEQDRDGRPKKVDVGGFRYGAGDFRTYASNKVTRSVLVVYADRVELADECFKALHSIYDRDLEAVNKPMKVAVKR